MYTLVKAIGLPKIINGQYETIDDTKTVNEIFLEYNSIYLEVNSTITNGLFVNFNPLKNTYAGYLGTIQDLFDNFILNNSLPLVNHLPTSVIKYATYADAIQTGYKIKRSLIGSSNPSNLPKDVLKDAVITRPTYHTDLSLIHTHCLVSINGFFHRTDYDSVSENAFIYDGGVTIAKTNANHVGLWSFVEIGALTKKSISLADIHPQTVGDSLYNKTYINTGTSLVNKSFFLVLGGYLVTPEDTVLWQINDTTIALDFSKLPLLERYFDSMSHIDLSSLGLDVSTIDSTLVNVQEYFSDDVLKKYLTLSQSFIVIVDNANTFINKLFVRNKGLVNNYTSFQEPVYPLFVSNGRLAEYWKQYENGYWSMSVRNSIDRNYIFSNTPLNLQTNVNPALLPFQDVKNSNGIMLQVGSYN